MGGQQLSPSGSSSERAASLRVRDAAVAGNARLLLVRSIGQVSARLVLRSEERLARERGTFAAIRSTVAAEGRSLSLHGSGTVRESLTCVHTLISAIGRPLRGTVTTELRRLAIAKRATVGARTMLRGA